jgi:Ca-activated chloride channel family protein
LLFPAAVWAKNPGAEGEKAFKEGRYEDAAKAFQEADLARPKDPRWRYNRGVAAFHAGDLAQSAAAFASAAKRAEDPEVAFRAEYNRGVAAMKQGDFAQAVEASRAALALRPEDPDAKWNLQLALVKLKEAEAAKKNQGEKQEGEQNNGEKDKGGQDQGQKGDKGENANKDQSGDKQAEKDSAGQEKAGDEDGEKTGLEQGEGKDGQGKESREGMEQGAQGQQGQEQGQTGETGEGGEKKPDMAGELKAADPAQAAREGQGNEDGKGQEARTMEIRKAEALLDNVREMPGARRMRAPEGPEGVPGSGKTW